MDYLEKLQILIEEEQPSSFFKLWEEYCFNDVADSKEIVQILETIQNSSKIADFGKIADSALSLWETLPDSEEKDRILVLILDLQTSNTKRFYDYALDYVTKKYKDREHFNEALRVVGLRDGREFQKSLSHFELLMHLQDGNFVFNRNGWGVGEVMGVSFLQQKLFVEFEGVMSVKDLSFETAFKTLTPLSHDHFLSRRFGDPDRFEAYAKAHPVETIECLLKDLGPKTAKEIKDELIELVIPEDDWNRWWQTAKIKIKKHTQIISPESPKHPYVLNVNGSSLIQRLQISLEQVSNNEEKLLKIYQFIRDLHKELKQSENRETVIQILLNLDLSNSIAQQIQRDLLLSEYLGKSENGITHEFISSLSEDDIVSIVHNISIVALQKQFLSFVHQFSSIWLSCFIKIFLITTSSFLREGVFKFLKDDVNGKELLRVKLLEIANRPSMFPEAFVWFLMKLDENDVFDQTDKSIDRLFLEASLNFMYQVSTSDHKDLGKKVYQLLTAQRYLMIRRIIQDAPIAYLKEFLLLSTKCPYFSSGDLGVLQSLAEVVQPDLKKNLVDREEDVLWTTSESFTKMKNKLQSLVGKEMIENAKEIETARALGDLRENSEYKFALEKRSRLQEEIKVLSEELNIAQILTKELIFTDKVNVGCKITLKNHSGEEVQYSILGPWDAIPEKNILSFKSKFVQNFLGKKVGDKVQFQDSEYTIMKIESVL